MKLDSTASQSGKLKSMMATALLLGIVGAASVPTAAFAKKGDLYRNSDGSCDAGDSKKGYWCVESAAARPRNAERGAGRTLPNPASCKALGGVWAGEDGKGTCTGSPRK